METTTFSVRVNHKGGKELALSRMAEALDRVTNYRREDEGIISFSIQEVYNLNEESTSEGDE